MIDIKKIQASRLRLGLILGLAVLILDQITKHIVLDRMVAPYPQQASVYMTDFFNVVLVWNRGISFGMLQHDIDYMPYILIAISFAICAWLVHWLRRAESGLVAAALGLVIGGAIGNVIDRFRFGAVVDFLDFHLSGHHWPAFNVADSAICVGVILLLIGSWRKPA